MRLPTPHDVLYRWHTEALKGVYGDRPDLDGEKPECGWFKTRVIRGGLFIPARIWMYQHVCPSTGELLDDEVLQCEVDGKYRDPAEEWPWLMARPISKAEYKYMVARQEWTKAYAPDDPAARPRQPVDWTKVPIPSFSKAKETSHE
jgi:hypothetical protein